MATLILGASAAFAAPFATAPLSTGLAALPRLLVLPPSFDPPAIDVTAAGSLPLATDAAAEYQQFGAATTNPDWLLQLATLLNSPPAVVETSYAYSDQVEGWVTPLRNIELTPAGGVLAVFTVSLLVWSRRRMDAQRALYYQEAEALEREAVEARRQRLRDLGVDDGRRRRDADA